MLAIINGKILPVVGEVLEKGTILVEDGKIKAIGAGIPVPEGAEVIDVSGCIVTPGLIDAHTHISVFGEPGTMPGMADGNEATSPNTVQVRALDALNPHDPGIAAARGAGFTTCYTGPGSANVIGGTGLSFKTREGDTIYDIYIPGSEMMKMALGENPRRVYGGNKQYPGTRMGIGAVLREALFDAKTYSDQLAAAVDNPDKAPKPDFRLNALLPVIRGEMKVRIHCHRADDIVTAIRILEEFGVRYSIEHCTEGWKIVDFLKEKKIQAVVGPLTMGPSKMEIWDTKLETPGIFEQAGIDTFCLTEDAGSDTKYLPMHIGLCIARGLSREMALKAVTINPAQLLGLADRVGSLEPGKDADIAIFDGDPFSNFTLCRYTIIEGEVYVH